MNFDHFSTVTELNLSKEDMFHLLNQPDAILANEEAEIAKLGNEPAHVESKNDGK